MSRRGKPFPVPRVPVKRRAVAVRPEPSSEPEVSLLDLSGIRLLVLEDDAADYPVVVYLWRDVGFFPEVMEAIRSAGAADYPVVYFDEARNLPGDFGVRRCPVRSLGESFSSWLARAREFNKRKPGLKAELVRM